MENLNITIIQTSLSWENIPVNLEHFSNKILALKKTTDVIILPEMFTTGFTTNAAAVAETMEGSAIAWMRYMSSEVNSVITGSLIIKEDGRFYNRLIWMPPNGKLQYYDKRHLFTLAGEHEIYSPGSKRLIVEWRGWKICPLICYDLRFPVWSRNTEDYDALIYVANWPAVRSHAWKSLIAARAIENQAYAIGVNRIGVDGNKMEYSGDSQMVDFTGKAIFSHADEGVTITATLLGNELRQFRKKRAFLADRDDFEIIQ